MTDGTKTDKFINLQLLNYKSPIFVVSFVLSFLNTQLESLTQDLFPQHSLVEQ